MRLQPQENPGLYLHLKGAFRKVLHGEVVQGAQSVGIEQNETAVEKREGLAR